MRRACCPRPSASAWAWAASQSTSPRVESTALRPRPMSTKAASMLGRTFCTAAEVDVADEARLLRAGDVVLDEHVVLEHGDLTRSCLLHDHGAVDGLAAGEELALGHDGARRPLSWPSRRRASGLEPRRALTRAGSVIGSGLAGGASSLGGGECAAPSPRVGGGGPATRFARRQRRRGVESGRERRERRRDEEQRGRARGDRPRGTPGPARRGPGPPRSAPRRSPGGRGDERLDLGLLLGRGGVRVGIAALGGGPRRPRGAVGASPRSGASHGASSTGSSPSGAASGRIRVEGRLELDDVLRPAASAASGCWFSTIPGAPHPAGANSRRVLSWAARVPRGATANPAV